MLQLATATGIIANDGVKMKPHLVKEVVDVVTHARQQTLREIKAEVSAKAANIDTIKRALVGVNIEGTGATAFRGAGYVAAGKTGTAQVVSIAKDQKYNAANTAERFRDHGLYMAFAPADNPQIALAMVVENAGFGGMTAAPIARRIFDYWLVHQYPSEQDIAAVRTGQAQAPVGTPRAIADVPGLPGAVASPAAAASAPAQPASAAAAPRLASQNRH
jgi:penicillin-binding protein 2